MALFTKTDVIAGAALLGIAGCFAWIGRDLPPSREASIFKLTHSQQEA